MCQRVDILVVTLAAVAVSGGLVTVTSTPASAQALARQDEAHPLVIAHREKAVPANASSCATVLSAWRYMDILLYSYTNFICKITLRSAAVRAT
jgi:hypothetical protein